MVFSVTTIQQTYLLAPLLAGRLTPAQLVSTTFMRKEKKTTENWKKWNKKTAATPIIFHPNLNWSQFKGSRGSHGESFLSLIDVIVSKFFLNFLDTSI